MKKIFLSSLFTLIISITFGQCFFGFEHINTAQNDSALVIHKYGFPNYTDFTLYQDNNDGWIIDTTLSNQTSDTLIFGTHADTLGTFKLYGTSVAGDTLGYAINKGTPSQCYPELLLVAIYWPPSSITAADGTFNIQKIDNGSDWALFSHGGQNNGDSILTSNVDEGIKTASFVLDGSAQDSLYMQFIIGDPANWANIQSGTMNCPVGVSLATDQSTCDGEAYIGQVQNGLAPYTYDWNGTGTYDADSTISGLCAGNHYVYIKDQNNDVRVCAFAMGSLDNGYFPPNQPSDTTIHTYTDYCVPSAVDSVSLIGSQVIDSISASVVWSFYENSILVGQLLDTVSFSSPNSTYNNVYLNSHLVCNGDTLKASNSVYTAAGYFEYPFTEVGFLGVDNNDLTATSPTLYPNPASDKVYIKGINEAESIMIYNNQGKMVKRTQSTEIDVSLLKAGSYFVHIFESENRRFIRKMVIQ
ncbi:MAG: T9SS type A sorting domain-containing protein [Brumimicrobium sp.]